MKRTSNLTKTVKIIAAAAMVCLVMLPTAGLRAVPTPGDIASKSQQAAELSREVDQLDKDLAIATEAYNSVKSELDATNEKVDETRKRLDEIKQSLKGRRKLLNGRAAAMYKNGRTSMLEVLLRTKDFSDFLQRADYIARVAESDSRLIRKIKANRDSVARMEQQLAEQQRRQFGLVQQASAKMSQIQSKLQQRQQLLTSINAEIMRMLQEEARQRSVESAALEKEAQAALAQAPDTGIARTAMKYLGVPYHYAGAGPGTCVTGEHRICFDCSGLTMYVYKMYGISMTHNAAAQFNQGIKIPRSQARPGDLVFFGMPPHHVGMYLGNDMFIHAPHTGDVVKVSKLSARSDCSGVCRYVK